MEVRGIIPVYVNIPGQGWTEYGVAEWVFTNVGIVSNKETGWSILPKAPTLSLAGHEYKFAWLEDRVLDLLRAGAGYFTLSTGVRAIRLSGYPVNVSTIHLLDLLRKLKWTPKPAAS